MTNYEKGFLAKCAEYGIDGSDLLRMVKLGFEASFRRGMSNSPNGNASFRQGMVPSTKPGMAPGANASFRRGMSNSPGANASFRQGMSGVKTMQIPQSQRTFAGYKGNQTSFQGYNGNQTSFQGARGNQTSLIPRTRI